MNKLNLDINNRKIIILYDSTERWIPEDIVEFDTALANIISQIKARGVEVEAVVLRGSVVEALKPYDPSKVVVFNWCDQLNFSDDLAYTIPDELEKLHFCYTGSNSKALKLSEDKKTVKDLLVKNNISTPKYLIVNSVNDLTNWTNFPAIVKPAGEHCSNGITKDSVVDSLPQLKERVAHILEEFPAGVIVEEFIGGSEYLIAIWGAEEFEALPIVELDYTRVNDYHERIYSFDAKWNPKSEIFTAVRQTCPAVIEPALEGSIKELAVDAFKVLGCDNYGRLEVRVKNGIPYVIDINPNSDMMGPNEMILSAAKLGYTHGDIFIKLCQFALKKALLI